MATLALACAENEGLRVVTEFPQLHGRIIGTPIEDVYEACVREDASKRDYSGKWEAIEFFVHRRCDATKLTVERLQALNEEWKPLANFQSALEQAVSNIPSGICDPKIREQYLNDLANGLLQSWNRDKSNWSNFVREIFGDEALGEPIEFLKGIAEKAFSPTTAGAIAGGVGGGTPEGLTWGALVGATAGFAVGMIGYSVSALSRLRSRAKNSPYRYLSLLEKNGVSFVVGGGR